MRKNLLLLFLLFNRSFLCIESVYSLHPRVEYIYTYVKKMRKNEQERQHFVNVRFFFFLRDERKEKSKRRMKEISKLFLTMKDTRTLSIGLFQEIKLHDEDFSSSERSEKNRWCTILFQDNRMDLKMFISIVISRGGSEYCMRRCH